MSDSVVDMTVGTRYRDGTRVVDVLSGIDPAFG